MLLPVAIGLAVMSVVMWRIEAGAFIGAMQDALTRRHMAAKVWALVKAIPLLMPLALDMGVTIGFITMLGLGGGITGAVTALAMSNTASIFIAREARKAASRAKQGTTPKLVTPTHAAAPQVYVPRWVDAYNRGFYGTLRRGLNVAEALSRPNTYGATHCRR